MNTDIKATVENLDMSQGPEAMKEIMGNFVSTATVEAVYGKPIKSGDVTIIPTAEVICGMGFGMGIGYGMGPAGESSSKKTEGEAGANEEAAGDAPAAGGAGSGGGGGGYTFSRPVALVISTPDGVRVEPVLDRTKILLAAFTTAGFMVGMMARMLRGGR